MKRRAILLLISAALLLCACGEAAQAPEATDEAESTVHIQPVPEEERVAAPIEISELMAANKAVTEDGGEFPDWVELHNTSDTVQELSSYSLSINGTEMSLADIRLESGEYRVVFCRGESALPAEGFVLELKAEGETVQRAEITRSENDVSFICGENGGFVSCRFPTPGYKNSDAGYEAFQKSRSLPELSINEVSVFNRSFRKNGGYHDWVELRNNGSAAIDLKGWYLSDSENDREKYALPHRRLESGETAIIFLESDGDSGFALNAGGDRLYLTAPDGGLEDYISLHDVPVGASCGRIGDSGGVYYFAEPTPGKENTDGSMLISCDVSADCRGGVFNDCESLSVTLSASGAIYYTLDGTNPKENGIPYTGTVNINKTAIIRAVCLEAGKLPGKVAEFSYIINENHTLPVASLVIDKADFTGRDGIYLNPTEDYERPAHISFYDGDESFEIYCGVKIHGATSRVSQDKKSFKLNFRSAYGGELEHDLFGNGVTQFSSVLLRAAQEGSFSTNMRDIVWHEAAQQCTDSLSTQDYRYCILYINGEYWGIYALREAHSAEHFAAHSSYSADDVEMWQGKWPADSSFRAVYNFALFNAMENDDNYAAVVSHIDLDALTAWTIIESYSGNVDINSPNVRFYYTHEDEKLHIALVDLDLSFFKAGHFTLSMDTGYNYSVLIERLMNNPQFSELIIKRMNEYLKGPLSKDNICAILDRLTCELRPEIARDGERWGYTQEQWEREVQYYMYDFMENYGYSVYETSFAYTACDALRIKPWDFENYFPDMP